MEYESKKYVSAYNWKEDPFQNGLPTLRRVGVEIIPNSC